MKKAQVGDIVLFGAYEQDGNTSNGVELLAWRVIGKEGKELLLLSEYVLDAKAFHSKADATDWSKSDIKRWLQEDFYKEVFSHTEQKEITSGPAGTVFLLSLEEVQECFSVNASDQNLQFLSDDRLTAKATEYAKKQNVWTMDGTACWWLRTEGRVSGTMVEITEDGSVYLLGSELNYSYNGVRPAIRLNLE